MQIKVAAARSDGSPIVAYDMTPLKTALPAAFAASQEPIIIPHAGYNAAYNKTFPVDAFVRIQDNSKKFTTVSGATLTLPLQPKAIQDEMGEAFDLDYGRMSGKLGVELPFTVAGNQNFVLQGYIDPPTEAITDSVTPGEPTATDGTQIWKITHNGVDTHPIPFPSV